MHKDTRRQTLVFAQDLLLPTTTHAEPEENDITYFDEGAAPLQHDVS
jgi:hypothetical protein